MSRRSRPSSQDDVKYLSLLQIIINPLSADGLGFSLVNPVLLPTNKEAKAIPAKLNSREPCEEDFQ